MKRTTLFALCAPATLAAALTPLALATPTPPAHMAKTTIGVTAREFKFTLRPTSARPGSVSFQIKNAGKIAHDLRIAGKTSRTIAAGRSTTLTVSLRRGTYGYICTIPGHAAAGMKGVFRVR